MIRKLSKASYNHQKAIKVKGLGSERDQRGRLVTRTQSKGKIGDEKTIKGKDIGIRKRSKGKIGDEKVIKVKDMEMRKRSKVNIR
jgi:hypothetical protein